MIVRLMPLVCLAVVLSLTACQPPALQGLPVRRTGDPIAADNPTAFPPDAPTAALAKDGASAAALLAKFFSDAAPLVKALRERRAQHPAPATYRLLQVPGWRFFAGGWVKKDEAVGDFRVTLDDGNDRAVGWDVTDSSNYAADMHPHFPSDAVRLQAEIAGTLAGGGRMRASFVLPLGESWQSSQGSGLGSVAQFGDAGNLVFEALNARLAGDGSLERSDLVLRGTMDGATMLFTGVYGRDGLIEAEIFRTAKPAGKVLPAGGGQVLFINDSGTYPL